MQRVLNNVDLPLQLWVGIFPRFVAIGFYFLSETLILIASPIIQGMLGGYIVESSIFKAIPDVPIFFSTIWI
jgi:hypothetical protein